MLLLYLVTLLGSPASSSASKIKVQVPNPEHSCEGILDTKKMSKAKFERIAELIRFQSRPNDPLGFIDSEEKLKAAKATVKENLEFVESSVKKIEEFRKSRWRKLGQYYLQKARAEHERQSAAIAFMETWNPLPLQDAPNEGGLSRDSTVPYEPGMTNKRRDQLIYEANERILKQPLEDRDATFLTCNQRLKLLADEALLEKFSVNFAYADCAGATEKDKCKKRYIITKEMPPAERQGRRMYLFQWAWYNNGACHFNKAKLELPNEEEGHGLQGMLEAAVSGVKCEEECPEE